MTVTDMTFFESATKVSYTVESAGIGPWGGKSKALLHQAGQYAFINVRFSFFWVFLFFFSFFLFISCVFFFSFFVFSFYSIFLYLLLSFLSFSRHFVVHFLSFLFSSFSLFLFSLLFCQVLSFTFPPKSIRSLYYH